VSTAGSGKEDEDDEEVCALVLSSLVAPPLSLLSLLSLAASSLLSKPDVVGESQQREAEQSGKASTTRAIEPERSPDRAIHSPSSALRLSSFSR